MEIALAYGLIVLLALIVLYLESKRSKEFKEYELSVKNILESYDDGIDSKLSKADADKYLATKETLSQFYPTRSEIKELNRNFEVVVEDIEGKLEKSLSGLNNQMFESTKVTKGALEQMNGRLNSHTNHLEDHRATLKRLADLMDKNAEVIGKLISMEKKNAKPKTKKVSVSNLNRRTKRPKSVSKS
jgi:hypothetical protein